MADKRVSEQDVIRLWGTPEEYYRTLEEFIEKHQAAGATIEYDYELSAPVRAIYPFLPVQVWAEHHALAQRLAEENREAPPPASDSGGE